MVGPTILSQIEKTIILQLQITGSRQHRAQALAFRQPER